jgi:hypothetical protein
VVAGGVGVKTTVTKPENAQEVPDHHIAKKLQDGMPSLQTPAPLSLFFIYSACTLNNYCGKSKAVGETRDR